MTSAQPGRRSDHRPTLGTRRVGNQQPFCFQARDGIRGLYVTGVQTCALPICDARQDRRREVGRVDRPVLDEEDVLAGPVRDEAVVREQDRLVVARAVRLHDGEHRVEVDRSEERRVGKEGRSRWWADRATYSTW